MKKYGTVIALGLAVVFGALAVWLASQWLQAKASDEKKMVREAVPLTGIVIAAQDLEIGTPLGKQNLTIAQWPKANVPKGAFDNIDLVAGRVAVTKLSAGEPLLAAELAEPGSGVGLVALIPPGMRAMSIRVDEVIGVSGFILPNTFVDVIAVGSPAENKQREAKTILEKVKVLAIAQETTTEEGKAKVVKTVTMELRPKDAEKLALQTHLASIHLILRNPLDDLETPPPAPEPVKVVKRKPAPAPKPVAASPTPPPPGYTVEVIKGSKSPEKVKFKSASSDERL
jgi:pilus assembly protein CpaB